MIAEVAATLEPGSEDITGYYIRGAPAGVEGSSSMSVTDRALDLEQTLRDHFGLEQFRPGQREVIEHVLQARDVLCVMPTGGGKSLCYQLPALLLPGLTLVVSPLIALMKDQVDALTQRGIRAALLNSTLDPAEQRARIQEIEAGRYDLVYVAPERFRSPRFLEVDGPGSSPALLAVDEAHCISEWGHDFRPDYARLGHARRRLGSPTCIALTATATDLVRRDIADQLDLRDPAQFVTGFDRPNLPYAVVEARRDADKLAALGRGLRPQPGSRHHLRLEPGAMRVGRTVPRARATPVGGRLPRRTHPRGADRRAGAVHERRGRGRRRDQRLRHGGRQGRHPLGDPLQHAGNARGLLPGGRPRWPRRPARRVRPALRLRRPLPPGTLHRERVSSRPRWSTRSTISSAPRTPTRSR